MSVPNWTILADPQRRDGLIIKAGGTAYAGQPRFIRDDILERIIEPLVNQLPVDLTGATLKVGVGPLDVAPSGGTFGLSFLGSSTGLTGLTYNITATALNTALNANANISAAGGVTVTGDTDLFTVVFTNPGARSLIAGDDTALLPPSYVRIARSVTGTASVREQQTIELYRRPFAYSEGWTPNTAGTPTLTQIAAGTSTTSAAWLVSLGGNTLGGNFSFTWGRLQTYRISVQAANDAVAEISTVVCVADVSGSLGGLYFDVPRSTGTMRVWIDVNNASTAPATPTGGTLLEVDVATNATATAVATAIQAKVDAESDFVAVKNGPTIVEMRESNVGVRTPIAAGTSTMTVATVRPGTNGSLSGSVVLFTGLNGSVAVWLSCGTQTIPATAAASGRAVQVAIGATDSANTIATAIHTAFASDPDFNRANTSNTVTLTDKAYGARDTDVTSSGSLSVIVTQEGAHIGASIPWNATAQEFQSLIGTDFLTVSDTADSAWLVKKIDSGADAAAAIADESLVWRRYFTGTLPFDTVALEYAIAEAGTDYADGVLEIVLTLLGKSPTPILQVPCTADANLIRVSGLSTPSYSTPLTAIDAITILWGITDFIGGTSTKLDSVATVLLAVPRVCAFIESATGALRFYQLRSGTDAEASPGIVRPDDYNAVTNAKVWEAIL